MLGSSPANTNSWHHSKRKFPSRKTISAGTDHSDLDAYQTFQAPSYFFFSSFSRLSISSTHTESAEVSLLWP